MNHPSYLEMDLEAPFSEFHSRESRKVLTYSGPDENGVIECERCRERFPDKVHFFAHASSSLTVGIRMVPPPFHNILGRWVKRRDFAGENSFGFYQCCNCTKLRGLKTIWISAYAYKSYGQGCKVCNDKLWVNAIFLWQNYDWNHRGVKGHKTYEKHLKDLCEACDLGFCRYRTGN